MNGGEVSCYMHDKMDVGQRVLLGVPAGLFSVPENPNPAGCVLVSAGIGVTPMWAFFNHLGSDHVKAVWCINPSKDRALFVDEFQRSGIPTTALTSGGGRCDLVDEADKLVAQTSKDCTFYICGPRGFMSAWNEALTKSCGVKEDNIKMEVFGTGTVCPAK